MMKSSNLKNSQVTIGAEYGIWMPARTAEQRDLADGGRYYLATVKPERATRMDGDDVVLTRFGWVNTSELVVID